MFGSLNLHSPCVPAGCLRYGAGIGKENYVSHNLCLPFYN